MGANGLDINSLPGGGRLIGESHARAMREQQAMFDEWMRQTAATPTLMAPANPENTEAQAERDRVIEEERVEGGRRRGRSSTILTSPLGVTGGTTGGRRLLGGV